MQQANNAMQLTKQRSSLSFRDYLPPLTLAVGWNDTPTPGFNVNTGGLLFALERLKMCFDAFLLLACSYIWFPRVSGIGSYIASLNHYLTTCIFVHA